MEFSGILHGETLIVVVKVTVDFPHPAKGADFLCPGFELLSIVTVGVEISRAMEAEVYKGSRNHLSIGEKGSVGEAEGNVVPVEEVIHLLAEEARVTEFKNIPEMRSKVSHKSRKNFPVEGEARGKLEKERSTLFPEKLNPPEELYKGLLDVPELLHVGDVPAGLHCKEERGWSLRIPPCEGCFLREVVEGSIDFHGIKKGGVESEPCPFGEILGIHHTFPVIVYPP